VWTGSKCPRIGPITDPYEHGNEPSHSIKDGYLLITFVTLDSSVDISLGYRLDDQGSRV
jgi:hypothetical protein